MKNRVLTTVLMGGLALTFSHGLALAGYEETIPPEILRRYEPEIVSNKRPVVVRITQAMIWGLRDQPDQGGDVYSFDLDPAKLSSVQVDVIRRWVRDGRKILFWGYADARKYCMLLSDQIEYSERKETQPYTLSKHPVNTDVRNLSFSMQIGTSRSYRDNCTACLVRYPPETEVVASCKIGVVAGRIPYGRGAIYVALHGENWNKGRDKDRWTLNFRQWMLGYRVPGAAETTTGGASDSKDAPPQDRILLKNGDTISGRILIEAFTIKTSYADLSFELPQVETVILEGAGQNIEVLVLRTGDKLSGVVGPDKVKLRLASGQETEIEKEKIKEIVLQQ